MSKRESLRILHIPYVYKSFMFFHMSKKHMPIAHPCLKNKFSVSDNQYPSKCQVEDKSSFLNLLYVKLAEGPGLAREKKFENTILKPKKLRVSTKNFSMAGYTQYIYECLAEYE